MAVLRARGVVIALLMRPRSSVCQVALSIEGSN